MCISSIIAICRADMLDPGEDAVTQPAAVVDVSDDANQTDGSLAATSNDRTESAQPVNVEGTLVSAEALSAAYRALGHAALSVVPGNPGDDPVL